MAYANLDNVRLIYRTSVATTTLLGKCRDASLQLNSVFQLRWRLFFKNITASLP